MSPHPSIPESLWSTVPPGAQAAILAVISSLEKRIADLEARLNQNPTNSSKPPSTDPPAVKLKRRPPAPPSGRKCGGQPGYKRHTRALVPPGQLRETFEVKPTRFRGRGASLQGEDPDPMRHQVAEVPAVKGGYAPRREAMGAPLDKGEPDTDLGRGVLGYLLAPNRIDDACVRALEVAEPRVERQPPSDSPLIGRPSGRRRR